MNKHIIAIKKHPENKTSIPMFNWKDNPAVLSLLDVVVQILAEEYIETAKQKPEAFLDKHR